MEKVSRRQLSIGLIGGAIAAPKILTPQTDFEDVEKLVKVKFQGDLNKMLKGQIKGIHDLSAERWKYPLPDCSEPGTMYLPVAAESKK